MLTNDLCFHMENGKKGMNSMELFDAVTHLNVLGTQLLKPGLGAVISKVSEMYHETFSQVIHRMQRRFPSHGSVCHLRGV